MDFANAERLAPEALGGTAVASRVKAMTSLLAVREVAPPEGVSLETKGLSAVPQVASACASFSQAPLRALQRGAKVRPYPSW